MAQIRLTATGQGSKKRTALLSPSSIEELKEAIIDIAYGFHCDYDKVTADMVDGNGKVIIQHCDMCESTNLLFVGYDGEDGIDMCDDGRYYDSYLKEYFDEYDEALKANTREDYDGNIKAVLQYFQIRTNMKAIRTYEYEGKTVVLLYPEDAEEYGLNHVTEEDSGLMFRAYSLTDEAAMRMIAYGFKPCCTEEECYENKKGRELALGEFPSPENRMTESWGWRVRVMDDDDEVIEKIKKMKEGNSVATIDAGNGSSGLSVLTAVESLEHYEYGYIAEFVTVEEFEDEFEHSVEDCFCWLDPSDIEGFVKFTDPDNMESNPWRLYVAVYNY